METSSLKHFELKTKILKLGGCKFRSHSWWWRRFFAKLPLTIRSCSLWAEKKKKKRSQKSIFVWSLEAEMEFPRFARSRKSPNCWREFYKWTHEGSFRRGSDWSKYLRTTFLKMKYNRLNCGGVSANRWKLRGSGRPIFKTTLQIFTNYYKLPPPSSNKPKAAHYGIRIHSRSFVNKITLI